MSCAKETLGYPTRTAAVTALRTQGLGTLAIAEMIGIPAKTVTALEASANRKTALPKKSRRQPTTIELDAELMVQLRPHAKFREKSVVALAKELLDTVVYEHLIDAVLDDGGVR